MIFLTGIPRCGSTWAGRALAHLIGGRYVHEPMNGHRHPEFAQYNMRYYRRDACDPAVITLLRNRVRAVDTRTRLSEFLRRRQSAVLKEVHATLAIECVHRHLRPDVVIMTRYPCAVAASWKRLGWLTRPWDEEDLLLKQSTLVEDHLGPFQKHILSSTDPFFRLGAYWGAIYYVLHRLAAAHPRWQWVVHEDLCSAPRQRFAELLRALGRTAHAEAFAFFDQHDRVPLTHEGPYDIYRLSHVEPAKWRQELSSAESAAVLSGAAPFGTDELLRSRVGTTAELVG